MQVNSAFDDSTTPLSNDTTLQAFDESVIEPFETQKKTNIKGVGSLDSQLFELPTDDKCKKSITLNFAFRIYQVTFTLTRVAAVKWSASE